MVFSSPPNMAQANQVASAELRCGGGHAHALDPSAEAQGRHGGGNAGCRPVRHTNPPKIELQRADIYLGSFSMAAWIYCELVLIFEE